MEMQTHIPKICSSCILTNTCSDDMIQIQTVVRNKCSAKEEFDMRDMVCSEAIRVNRYRVAAINSRRRVAILKRRMLIGMMTLTLLVMGVLIGSNLLDSSKSEAENSKEIYKYYTSIQVESGDTLWSIADKYASSEYSDRDTYMKELLALNHLSDTTIHSGQYLTVAYYSDIQK